MKSQSLQVHTTALVHLAEKLLRQWQELEPKWQNLPLGIGISAGSDSCALALAAASAARNAPSSQFFPEVTLLHIRHELRGEESEEDWHYCGELAASLGLPLKTMRAALLDGPDLEARARDLRYKALRTLHPIGLIATGHHLQDQAETVLLRILRGAGALGLCGISPLRDDGIWRPFLDEPRELLREALKEATWSGREDSSNLDVRFSRNALRHQWLPERERQEPGTTIALAQVARSAWSLRPHLLARMDQIETLTDSVMTPGGWGMDLVRWEEPADDPELELVLERLWTKTGRRPWSRPHRIRLLEDVLAGKTGMRKGGQGEIARFGNRKLAVEVVGSPFPNGRSLAKVGS